MNPNDQHVYPVNDLQEHFVEGPGCACNPTIEVIGASLLYIHNSFDHREIVEQALEILNGTEEEE